MKEENKTPNSPQEPKTPVTYTYDFPEQRELSKDLQLGDRTSIAEMVGRDISDISKMVNGKRKMAPEVKELVIIFSRINKQKLEIAK